MLETLKQVCGDVLVTQAAVDVFAHRVFEMEVVPGRMAGTLTQRDGQLRRTDIAPIQLDMILGVRREALTWVKKETSTRPAAGPKGLASRLLSGLATEVGEHFYDDVLAAAQSRVPLLTEDRGYREIAQSVGVNSFGLYALLQHSTDNGLLTPVHRIELLAKMCRAGHHFMTVNSGDLRQALAIDVGCGPTLKALIGALGGAGADLPTHFAVSLEFLEGIWSESATIQTRLELGKLFADRLLEGNPVERDALIARLFADPDDWVRALYVAGMRATGANLI